MYTWSLKSLKEKLSKSGGSLSSNESIYIEDSEALIVVSTASQIMKTGLSSVLAIYQDAIDEAEEVWNDGLARARSVGADLSESEILDALASMGATKSSIVAEPTVYYEGKIAEAKAIGESFDQLATEITTGITQLVQKDQDLMSQIG